MFFFEEFCELFSLRFGTRFETVSDGFYSADLQEFFH